MNKISKHAAVVHGGILAFLVSALFIPVLLVTPPSDYLPQKINRSDRRGAMYGYVFLDWESLMSSGVEDQYMDLVNQCLDFCYIHAQWSKCALDNDTLEQDYLGNLTAFIAGLGARGVQVVVHVWVSSYSPSWMHPFVPELIGKGDRWDGIDPDTTNSTLLQHRNALKWSMVHFQEMLCTYFIDENVDQHILGFCLDDETQSENWLDFFSELTTTIHGFNSSWETMAMFNRIDKYHLTGDAGMDVHGMDPYNDDAKFVEKIHLGYELSGVDKVSVLIDAMGDHDNTIFHDKMRRQAWIAWFMGADSIGWYTFLYGSDDKACARNRWISGQGPLITAKTNATIETAIDIGKLNEAWNAVQALPQNEQHHSLEQLQDAYALAKVNDFDGARLKVQEVIDG